MSYTPDIGDYFYKRYGDNYVIWQQETDKIAIPVDALGTYHTIAAARKAVYELNGWEDR